MMAREEITEVKRLAITEAVSCGEIVKTQYGFAMNVRMRDSEGVLHDYAKYSNRKYKLKEIKEKLPMKVEGIFIHFYSNGRNSFMIYPMDCNFL